MDTRAYIALYLSGTPNQEAGTSPLAVYSSTTVYLCTNLCSSDCDVETTRVAQNVDILKFLFVNILWSTSSARVDDDVLNNKNKTGLEEVVLISRNKTGQWGSQTGHVRFLNGQPWFGFQMVRFSNGLY